MISIGQVKETAIFGEAMKHSVVTEVYQLVSNEMYCVRNRTVENAVKGGFEKLKNTDVEKIGSSAAFHALPSQMPVLFFKHLMPDEYERKFNAEGFLPSIYERYQEDFCPTVFVVVLPNTWEEYL